MAERILKMDYISLLKTTRAVSKKLNKPITKILIDIIDCGIKYQAGYNDYLEFEFYLMNHEQRSTYLTRGKNNKIIKRYNNKAFRQIFENKKLFNHRFAPFINRDFLDLSTSDFETFKNFMISHPTVIAKPSNGSGGGGIDKYCVSDYDDLKQLYDLMISKKQDLIETFVTQHHSLNTLYPDSVNTLRMFTFYKDGKAHFLQAILKIGNGGVVDNFSSGGMYTFTDENGIVDVPAIDKYDNHYSYHPITGTNIIGFQVPMFKEAIKTIEKAAEVVPEVAYIGWDMAISENGPVIIEGNFYPGIFQRRASFSKNKTGIIPLYRKYINNI